MICGLGRRGWLVTLHAHVFWREGRGEECVQHFSRRFRYERIGANAVACGECWEQLFALDGVLHMTS